MTNFEYIKNMTVGEMAAMINRMGNFPCMYCKYEIDPRCAGENEPRKCQEGIKEFLESERK